MLRPVDFQSLYPRTLDVQKVQETKNNRPITEQQEFARELMQQTEKRQSRVIQSDPSVGGQKIKEQNDNEKKRQSKYKRFVETKKKTAAEEPSSEDPEHRQHIDFKV